MLRSMELKLERARVHGEMKLLHEKAAGEGRDLLASEQKQWDRLQARLEELERAILRAEELEDEERASARPIDGDGSWGRAHGEPEILAPRESVRDWAERKGLIRGAEPSLGELVQAQAGLQVGAVLREADLTKGGVLVPAGVSAEIVDLARSRSVLVQAGAQTRPIEVVEQKYPRLETDPTASWVAENASIPESDTTFGAVVHRPHKLASLMRAPRELLEDAPELDAFLRRVLAEIFALELDKAGLRGDDVHRPAGIRFWSGITVVSMGANGATPTNYDPLMDAIAAVRTSNFEPTAWIGHPRDFNSFGKLKATDNQPLQPPADVAALRRFSTTSIPTNLTQGTSSDTSEAYVGDFSEYLFTIRVAFQVQVLKERYADNDQVGILARVRADGAPMRDAAFAVITGLRP